MSTNTTSLDKRTKFAADTRRKTLTIIGTYQCTAACTQCCFESSPALKGQLELEQIKSAVAQAKALAPNLQVVVFSGGEVSLLKEDLFAALQHCNDFGFKTRIVTNASWAKSPRSARNFLKRATSTGLTELNISTGIEHAEWVPVASVANAASAAADLSVPTVVTIEGHSFSDDKADKFQILFDLARTVGPSLRIVRNSWMEFKSSELHPDASLLPAPETFGPCGQLFSNVVVTPRGEISACCGLTFEHIPEMKVSKLAGDDSIRNGYEYALNDFSKIWLSVEGPAKMLSTALGEEEAKRQIGSAKHICEVCAILHQNEEAARALKARYIELAPAIVNRFNMRSIELSI